MATIQIDQKIQLERVIVEALRHSAGKLRTIREIKESLYRHCHYLKYSKEELILALETLIHDGFHLDGIFYHLRVKIYLDFLRKPDIKFWLANVSYSDMDGPSESLSVQIPVEKTTVR